MSDLWVHKESGTLHTRPWILNWYVKGEWKKLSPMSNHAFHSDPRHPSDCEAYQTHYGRRCPCIADDE